MTSFPPTRAAARQRLAAFVPNAGLRYAAKRNYDMDTHTEVSCLSPYIRHRIITEEDVLHAVLAEHSAAEADKFISEVCWRTYWKGVLERRPTLWTSYKADLQSAWNAIQTQSGMRHDWEGACMGKTGIDCFDHWANELVTTGYLHNHARMWLASIWIFTLGLPWQLGADFFLRHLLDGDAASNTLSWRWVGGLQTKGKTYLARPDNIEKYTDGRFRPSGLARNATPLNGPELPPLGDVPLSDPLPIGDKVGYLVTEDDLAPKWCVTETDQTAVLSPTQNTGPLQSSRQVIAFKQACLDDFITRHDQPATPVMNVAEICQWAQNHDLRSVVSSYIPVGATADRLASLRLELAMHDISLSLQVRPFDSLGWTHATHGFFKFKPVIPEIIQRLN